MTQEQVRNIFTYHAPQDGQNDRYVYIREMAYQFADEILRLTPSSAEQTLAIRHLQTAVMFANAAIAINEAE